MKTPIFFAIILASITSACGKHVIVGTRTPLPDCNDYRAATNCRTGNPPAIPAPVPTIGLVFTGDVTSPPPSGYTLQGHARVPSGTPNSWQALGYNNQPPVPRTVSTTMTQAGECRNVDVKVVVTNGGSNSGTYYFATNGNRFRICEENGKVVVEFEDAGDNLFNDYRTEISSTNGQPLRYQIVGNALQVCLD